MNAAACAVGLAGLPFDGPVAAVRLGLINGEWVVNPTYQEIEDATFDIVVAGSKSDDGGVDVLMIEGEAPVHTWSLLAEGALAPTEEVVAQGLEVAKAEIAKIIAFQDEFIAAHGVHRDGVDAHAAVRRRPVGRAVRELRGQARGRDRAGPCGA